MHRAIRRGGRRPSRRRSGPTPARERRAREREKTLRPCAPGEPPAVGSRPTLAGKERPYEGSCMPPRHVVSLNAMANAIVFDQPGAKVRLDSIPTRPPPKMTKAKAKARFD